MFKFLSYALSMSTANTSPYPFPVAIKFCLAQRWKGNPNILSHLSPISILCKCINFLSQCTEPDSHTFFKETSFSNLARLNSIIIHHHHPLFEAKNLITKFARIVKLLVLTDDLGLSKSDLIQDHRDGLIPSLPRISSLPKPRVVSGVKSCWDSSSATLLNILSPTADLISIISLLNLSSLYTSTLRGQT